MGCIFPMLLTRFGPWSREKVVENSSLRDQTRLYGGLPLWYLARHGLVVTHARTGCGAKKVSPQGDLDEMRAVQYHALRGRSRRKLPGLHQLPAPLPDADRGADPDD